MPKYIVWYKKELEAKNIKQAINRETKVKPEFHAIEEVKDEIKQGASAIGFEIYEDEE